MFKVNNKKASIVDFEQVNVSWDPCSRNLTKWLETK